MPYEWDKTKPTGSQPMSDVDDAVRDTRAGVEDFLDDEHTIDVSNPAAVTCKHALGSARAGYDTEANKPTTGPGIETGRLFVASDSKKLMHGNGSAVEYTWVDQASNADKLDGYDGSWWVPPGAVMAFARSTPPDGWLECNGQAVSRTTYAALFAAIGTTFGAGDGSTLFNLPDLRGEFIRGWDHGRGVDLGRALGDFTFGSFQSDNLREHSHEIWGKAGVSIPDYFGGAAADRGIVDAGTAGASAGPWVSTTGGSETRPRNVALMYCIKY